MALERPEVGNHEPFANEENLVRYDLVPTLQNTITTTFLSGHYTKRSMTITFEISDAARLPAHPGHPGTRNG